MAITGTPHEGVDNVLLTAYSGTTLYLMLYTNAQNSLDRDTVLADLAEVSNVDSGMISNGYAAIELTGTWSSTDSVITYDDGTPDNPIFSNSGLSEDWETANGSAIVSATHVLHFADFGAPRALEVGGQLEVDLSSGVT